jgi:PhzF family phenazine biosynthesis protein
VLRIPLYQVDVFAEKLFAGNPAAVCPLQRWLPDATMQAIAAENNLAETAFFVKDETGEADFLLRWFTPTFEIELCGHATLASGHVLLNDLNFQRDQIRFRTLKAGTLAVRRDKSGLWLDLPARMPVPLAHPPADLDGLGVAPQQLLESGNKYFAVFERADDVQRLGPDFARLRRLGEKGVIITAPGRNAGEDFVSRFFAPGMGIDEDPATGSAHCLLVPYWAKRLGKSQLNAAQVSPRGARLACRLNGERVEMSGPVVPYLRGEITIPS